jgi:hypothetical protein
VLAVPSASGRDPVDGRNALLIVDVTNDAHGLAQVRRPHKQEIHAIYGGDFFYLVDRGRSLDHYRHERVPVVSLCELGHRDGPVAPVETEWIHAPVTAGSELGPSDDLLGVGCGGDLGGHDPGGTALEAAGHRRIIRRRDPDEAVEAVGPAGCSRQFDVLGGEAAVLEIDPETVEAALHAEIANDVVVEHSPHRKQDQPLAALKPVLDEISDVGLLGSDVAVGAI